MANVPIQLRVKPATAEYLDRLAAQATTPGATATRASVGASLLDRLAAGQAAGLLAVTTAQPDMREADRSEAAHTHFGEVYVPGCPGCAAEVPRVQPQLSDAERLKRAIGDLAPGSVDRLVDPADPLPKGTTRNVLRGASLATAGGGRLLKWVEAFERKGGL